VSYYISHHKVDRMIYGVTKPALERKAVLRGSKDFYRSRGNSTFGVVIHTNVEI